MTPQLFTHFPSLPPILSLPPSLHPPSSFKGEENKQNKQMSKGTTARGESDGSGYKETPKLLSIA